MEKNRKGIAFGHGRGRERGGGRGRGTTKKMENRNAQINRDKRGANKGDDYEDMGKKLEEKLALAMEVMDSELTTGRKNYVDNRQW